MKKQKNKLTLEKHLETAKKTVLQAIRADNTFKYGQLMKKVIKQYKRIVTKAARLENFYLKPMVKIDKKIINELRKYINLKNSNPDIIQKCNKNGKNFLKRIEEYLVFNIYDKSCPQTIKSILAYMILLALTGIIFSDVKGESNNEIDYNNLPKTIEDSDIEQFAAFNSNTKKRAAESNEFIKQTKTEKPVEKIKSEINNTLTEETIKQKKVSESRPVENISTSPAEGKKDIKEDVPTDIPKNIQHDISTDITEDTPKNIIKNIPKKIQDDPLKDIKKNIQNDYEIHIVESRNTLWGLTKKQYRNFSERNIYIFIDELLSPLNNKGRMDDYKWEDPDERNPHLIYPQEKIKMPDLSEVDPLSIPKELRDLVKHDNKSILYTARRANGNIILINYSKREIAIIT